MEEIQERGTRPLTIQEREERYFLFRQKGKLFHMLQIFWGILHFSGVFVLYHYKAFWEYGILMMSMFGGAAFIMLIDYICHRQIYGMNIKKTEMIQDVVGICTIILCTVWIGRIIWRIS